MIRYGIVGLGGFAGVWVRSLANLEKAGIARLAAAVVRNPDKYPNEIANATANGVAIYPTLDDMLARAHGQVDVIGVPTGIADHVPMAAQAMEAGYPVLVEKPVAATIQEVLALQEVERRSGRWCGVGFQFIFSPTIQWLKARLLSGRLGAIREARSVIGWPRGAKYYARNAWAGQLRRGEHWVLDGPATNATAHHLMNMLYLAAAQEGGAGSVSSVRAELYRARRIPGYDTSCIEVRTAGGARLLHVATHAVDELLDPVMDVICTNGTIHWQANGNTAVIRYADGQVEQFADPDAAHVHDYPMRQVAQFAAGRDAALLCGLAEGALHVLTVNLAFESSAGIVEIPEQYTRQGTAGDGSPLIGVTGMADLLKQALAQGLMFSELGAPWARRTQPVPAQGYTHFPQSDILRHI